MSTPTVALVADDLTGAADAVAPFAARWQVELRLAAGLAGSGGERPTVYAETTDSRARTPEDAASLTHTAVTTLREQGADHLFVKIDSTMRGSIPGQISGALEAWGPDSFAVLCPAYPQHGRTVTDNTVFVDGVPLVGTGAAVDPVTPVSSSVLADLVPGSVHLPAPRSVTALAADLTAAAANGATVISVDAAHEQHLSLIAGAIQQVGERAVAVGSSGLAAALSRTWLGDTPAPVPVIEPVNNDVLVVVSSLHPVARAQSTALLASGFLPANVVSTPAERAESARSVAQSVARNVQERLTTGVYGAIVFVGGDGALATLRQLGATALHIHGELFDGVPRGTIIGGIADGLAVVTKSGGFGGDGALVEIVSSLQPQNHTQKRTTA